MKNNFLSAISLLLAAGLWINAAQAQQTSETKQAELSGSLNVTTDRSDGTGETNINYVEEGHRYKIKLNGSKIVNMSVDGKAVPAEEYSKYDPLVKKILTQIEKDKEQAERDREQASKDRVQADKDRAQAEKDREQARKDRETAEQERQTVNNNRQRIDEDRAQAAKDRAQAERDREQARKDRAQAQLDREQAAKDRKQAEEDRKLLQDMIDELIKEKLVESREALTSLELDEDKMVVNGKEQPENVHSRFKAKYLKGTHGRINYRNSDGSRHMSVEN